MRELISQGSLRPDCLPILQLISPKVNEFVNKPSYMMKVWENMLYECDNQRRRYVKHVLKYIAAKQREYESRSHTQGEEESEIDRKALDSLNYLLQVSKNAYSKCLQDSMTHMQKPFIQSK